MLVDSYKTQQIKVTLLSHYIIDSFMQGQSEPQFRAIFLYLKTAYHPLSGHWQKCMYK